jgi:predicted phage terminase large subunit-like protein
MLLNYGDHYRYEPPKLTPKQLATLKALPVEDLAYSNLLAYNALMVPGYKVAPHNVLIAEHLMAVEKGDITRLAIFLPPRHGKKVADNTMVLTPLGWKKHGDIYPGDYVFGPDGKSTLVTFRSTGDICDLDIEFTNGEVITTHRDHLWAIYDRKYPSSLPFLFQTQDLIELSAGNFKYRWRLPDRKIPDCLSGEDLNNIVPHEHVGIKDIRPAAKPEMGHCIKVDRKDGLYLVGKQLVVTHNTMLASELFPSWYLGRNPEKQIIATTYSHDRASDVGRNVRGYMIDPLWKEIFPQAKISADSKSANKIGLIQGGNYFSVGVGGAIVGRGAHCVTGDSIIETQLGPIRMDMLYDLKRPMKVLSINEKTGKLSYCPIVAKRKTKNREIYEITTNSGNIIKATGEHRFFVCGSGYKYAKDLREGDKIVEIPKQQSLYNVRKTQKWSRKDVQGLLSKSKGSRNSSNLCILWKNFQQESMRNSQGNKKRTQRSLLFSRLLAKTSCNQEPKMLRSVRKARPQKNNEILFGYLQKTGSPKKEVPFSNSLPTLWQNFYAFIYENTILFQKMSKCCAFYCYAGNLQPSLQKWNKLFKIFYRNETINKIARSKLCCLRTTRKDIQGYLEKQGNKANQFSSTSYRHEPNKQCSGEFNPNVQKMSCNFAQIRQESISSIKRYSNQEYNVYDIQVAKNSNFFANGILTHNCFLIDDPIRSRLDAESKIVQKKLRNWYRSVAFTRLMPGNSAIVVILTRWSFWDLPGWLLQEHKHENWVVLELPAIATEENDPIGRRQGEALWPSEYPVKRLEAIKRSVGTREWNSQYQQKPLPEEGGMLQLNWFKTYNPKDLFFLRANTKKYANSVGLEHTKQKLLERGKKLFHRKADYPRHFVKVICSWDTAFKPQDLSDPSACTVWGITNDNLYYLIWVINERLEFPDLVAKAKLSHELSYVKNCLPFGAVSLLIEDKASGQSLIQELRRSTKIPIIPYIPKGDKTIRFSTVTNVIESGRIFVPTQAPWLVDYQTQLIQFPLGRNDDMVDSTSQFLDYIQKPKLKRANKNIYWK